MAISSLKISKSKYITNHH